jgi:superfamily I DNA and/or RNA helicase
MSLINHWKNCLIDTSGRNTLLYFKFASQNGEQKRNFLNLINFDNAFLEKLLNGQPVSLNDENIETQIDRKKKNEEHQEQGNTGRKEEYRKLAKLYHPDNKETGNEEKFKQLQASFNCETKEQSAQSQIPKDPLAERKKLLDKLRLKDKTAEEDLGTNILYLTYGFLHWSEPNKTGSLDGIQKNISPLFIIPLDIIKTGGLVPRYSITLDEDEAIVLNPALRVYLKQSFGVNFDFVPEKIEDEEINLEAFNPYFDFIEKIVSKNGWRVDKQVKTISTFGFANLAMYKEMEEWGEEMSKHSLISSLTTKEPYSQESVKDALTIDTTIHAKESHCVIDADSSQIEAIQAAKDGLSFVLDGPPGTGKSQTIVNIIAELMGQGKKVLFVSQKKAALDVVKSRLDSCSLGSFCLDLHNHQTKNKEFIEKLVTSFNHLLNEQTPHSEQKQSNHFDELEDNRKHLNAYANKLKEKLGNLDKTIFQLYAASSSLEAIENVPFTIENVISFDELKINRIKKLLSNLTSLYSVYSVLDSHPWKHLNRLEPIGFQEKEMLQDKLEKTLSIVNDFNSVLAKIYKLTGYSAQENSFSEFHKILDSLILLTEEQLSINKSWLELSSYATSIEETYANQDEHTELQKLKENIESFTTQNSLREKDVDEIIQQIDEYLKFGFLGFILFTFSSSKKALITSFYKANLPVPKLENIRKDLLVFKSFLQIHDKIKAKNRYLKSFYEDFYKDLETDWESILKAFLWLNKISASNLGLNQSVKGLLSDSFKKQEFVDLLNRARSLENEIRQLMDENYINFFDLNNWSNLPLIELIKVLNEKLLSLNMLDDWIKLCQIKSKLKEESLPNFIEKVQKINLAVVQLEQLFEKRFYRLYLDEVEKTTPLLASFSGAEHTKTIEDFQQLDQNQFTLNQQRVFHKLKSILSQKYSSEKELQVQRKELNSLAGQKRPRKKIRQIVKQLRSLILLICPCWMMSPLSVSQFIELNKEDNSLIFDTVIFDEASQIFPQDAICSIFRGKQLIVSGDPKQMPPTNIGVSSVLSSEDEDEDEDEELPEFESILDLVSSSLTTNRRLRWHYRSKYEELINPSNCYIYNDDLITFPQSEIPDRRPIEAVYIENGVFDKKQNLIEANKLIDKLIEVCRDNKSKGLNKSLGVIAMGIGQQDCIRECLHERLKIHPDLVEFLDEEKSGGLFIKNLENVQGDERDIIFLSIGYGKNPEGKFFQRFGPINQEVGHRRLNVAVTRAKEKVYVFSSFHFTDIRIDEKSKKGVRFLQSYLKYAETGEIDRSIGNSFEKCESPLEEQIMKALQDLGYTVRSQIGCSNYRIDLGIVHPKQQDKFILGIECDGAMYHSAQTARERDRLRQQILENMGWKIHRIWSRDWWRNKNNEIHKIKMKLETMVNV